MGRSLLGNKWTWLCAGILVAGIGGYAWLERANLRAAYHARAATLAASPEARDHHVEQLIDLGTPGTKMLVRQLLQSDQDRLEGVGNALIAFGNSASLEAGERETLSRLLVTVQPQLSPVGQKTVLGVFADGLLLENACDADLGWSAKALLQTRSDDPEVLAAALPLAEMLFAKSEKVETAWLPHLRSLVAAGLEDEREAVLACAVRLAAREQVGLQLKLNKLLRNPSIAQHESLRILLIAVLGANEEWLDTDVLLSYLHDASAEVRALTEQSLRSRGLTGSQMQLARQLTHPEPSIRAGVAAQIPNQFDLDPKLWLERLSRDASPAVRASAVRAAGSDPERRLTLRIHQMALEDNSPTVRQIAEFYVRQRPAGQFE